MKRSLMICRFPGGGVEHSECVDWLIQMYSWAMQEPTVSTVGLWRMNDTPVSMSRNACLAVAQHNNYDFVLMIDSDMAPDQPGKDAKPFLPTAWEFALKQEQPCLIGAPYCAGPPREKVVVYRWATDTSGDNVSPKLEEFPREDAAQRSGFERVAALATGLLLIDMRALNGLEHPYFDYEWSDNRMVRKVSTEDINFTRDVGLKGTPLYVAWDSWSGHWKMKLVTKPEVIDLGQTQSRLASIIRQQTTVQTTPVAPVAPVVASDVTPMIDDKVPIFSRWEDVGGGVNQSE